MKRLTVIVWSTLLTAACSTTPPTPPSPAPTPPQAMAPVARPAPPAPAPVKIATVAAESPLLAFERMESLLKGKSIYFDYDKADIKPDEESLISQHAKLLESYSGDSLTLQGNCDERGGREYNLALGQRRAEAVKERLVLLGVPAARIETVSYGKERPREQCHQERCWKENRRADFVDRWNQQQATR